jgi:ABC-type polysaccharide/polyol phosphate export permease
MSKDKMIHNVLDGPEKYGAVIEDEAHRWWPLRQKVDLIGHLVWRDFVLRYKRSMLGILWSFISPLAQLIVFVFLFRKIIPLGIEAYPAFVFCALLPWVWFSSSLTSSGGLFLYNRDLVRRPNFEPSVLVTVNTLSHLIHYLIFLPILFLILGLYGRPVGTSLLVLPLLLLIQIVLTIGVSLMIATLNVFYRDVEQMVGLGTMLLFYLTPVFYSPQVIGERFRILFTLNPVAVLVQGYRQILFYGQTPDWGSLLFAGGIGCLLFGLGYFIYNRQLSNVFDTI